MRFDSSFSSSSSFVWRAAVITMTIHCLAAYAWAPPFHASLKSHSASPASTRLPSLTTTAFWSCQEKLILRHAQSSSPSALFKLALSLENGDGPENEETEISGPRKPDAADGGGGDDCEDECDIDWDAMPGWDENDSADNAEKEAQQQPVASAKEETRVLQPEQSPETLRLRLEMAWQQDEAAEDCDIEEPVTCGSEPCQTCRGRGWSDCRFCHGTMLLRNSHARINMGESTGGEALSLTTTTTATTIRARTKWSLPCDTFTPCRICHQGVETCTTCKGSGWVASWTQLSNPQPPQPAEDEDNDDEDDYDDDDSNRRRLLP